MKNKGLEKDDPVGTYKIHCDCGFRTTITKKRYENVECPSCGKTIYPSACKQIGKQKSKYRREKYRSGLSHSSKTTGGHGCNSSKSAISFLRKCIK